MSSEEIDINFELAESINDTIGALLEQLIQIHQLNMDDIETQYAERTPEDMIDSKGLISSGNDIIKESVMRLHDSISGLIRFEDVQKTFPKEIEDQLLDNVNLFYNSMNTYTKTIVDQYSQVLEDVSSLINNSSENITDIDKLSDTINGIQSSTSNFFVDIQNMNEKLNASGTSFSLNLEIQDDIDRYSSIMDVFTDYLTELNSTSRDISVGNASFNHIENSAIDSMINFDNANIIGVNISSSIASFDYNFSKSNMIIYLRNIFKSMTEVLRSKIIKSFSSIMNKNISEVLSKQITNIIDTNKTVSISDDVIDKYNQRLEQVTGNIIDITDSISRVSNEDIFEQNLQEDVSIDSVNSNIDNITNQLTDILTFDNKLFMNQINKNISQNTETPGNYKQPSTQRDEGLNVDDIIKKYITGKTWLIDIDIGVVPSDPGYVRKYTAFILNKYISQFVQTSIGSMIR